MTVNTASFSFVPELMRATVLPCRLVSFIAAVIVVRGQSVVDAAVNDSAAAAAVTAALDV